MLAWIGRPRPMRAGRSSSFRWSRTRNGWPKGQPFSFDGRIFEYEWSDVVSGSITSIERRLWHVSFTLTRTYRTTQRIDAEG